MAFLHVQHIISCLPSIYGLCGFVLFFPPCKNTHPWNEMVRQSKPVNENLQNMQLTWQKPITHKQANLFRDTHQGCVTINREGFCLIDWMWEVFLMFSLAVGNVLILGNDSVLWHSTERNTAPFTEPKHVSGSLVANQFRYEGWTISTYTWFWSAVQLKQNETGELKLKKGRILCLAYSKVSWP